VVLMGTMPSIEFREGEVLANSIVSDRPGSKLLRIKARDKEHAAEYSPGHVLALRIPGVEEEHVEGKHGDGCTAPYTITSCNRAKGTMSVLYRVIEGGRMSQRLDKISRGGAVLFGGRFKDAIGDAVAEEASHVICISTGVGLGPVVGFAQEELVATNRQITLYGGFRDVRDICLQDEVERLAEEHNAKFAFLPCISSLRDERYPFPDGFTGLRGRVSEIVPQILDPEELLSGNTHVHLVGNGGMVNLLRQALLELGMQGTHVTHEIYFNHKEQPDPTELSRIVDTLKMPPVRMVEWSGAET